MKPPPEVAFAAFVGIDWSDTKHDICLQAGNSEAREFAVVPHRPAAIDAWASALRQRFQGRPVAVCLELAKGPLVMPCRSTISWCSSRSIRPRWRNTVRRATLQAIERFDAEIATVSESLPDYALFRALPAAGPAFAPRLLAAFGEQRERYHSAAELQRYTGIAPVTESSGNQHWVHWRLQCPTFIRQTFVEWAGATIPRSFWAAAYYRQQRAKGCSHHAAVRALAFKWIRILYRCWQTRTPYDESTYLNALKRRGSPLLASMMETAKNI